MVETYRTECLKKPSAYKHIYRLCTLLLPFVFMNYTANPVSLTLAGIFY